MTAAPPAPCQAVLFDLDGTLIDSLTDLAESMNSVLGEMGYPTHPREAYRYFVGDGMETLVRRTLPPERRDEAMVAKGLAAMRTAYADRRHQATRPYPGIPELLDALTARQLPMIILSNKPDDFTREAAASLLGRWSFRAVRGVRPETPKKPEPAGALALAAELAIPPAAFLYLGDTSIDMLTANRAGMFPVGVLWGFRTAEELRESGAGALISTPLDLLPLIDGFARSRPTPSS